MSEPPPDPESLARSICLNKLDHAPRTRAELATALRGRLVPDDVACSVLDRLEEVGLIDDRAYAEAWVRSRHSSKKLASRALARELTDKGVAREIAAEALAAVTPESEEATAAALVRSTLPSLRRADPRTRERRLAAVLGRKGYPPDIIFGVVRRETDAATARWLVEDSGDSDDTGDSEDSEDSEDAGDSGRAERDGAVR